jgi:hypothetical protein
MRHTRRIGGMQDFERLGAVLPAAMRSAALTQDFAAMAPLSSAACGW